MNLYAIMNGETPNTCLRIEARDDDPPAFVEWVAINDVTPRPEPGWTYDGTTWTAPIPTRADEGMKQAETVVNQLVSELPALSNQIATDAATFAATQPGSTLTQEHIDALHRIVEGFNIVQGAILAHAVLTGHVDPTIIVPS